MAAEGRKKPGERRDSGVRRSPVREKGRPRSSPEGADSRDTRRDRSTASGERDPYDDPYR